MHAFQHNMLIPVVDETIDVSRAADVIGVLDAVATLPSNCNVKVRTSLPDAEYAFKLWASAKNCEIADRIYREDGQMRRVISIYDPETLAHLASLVFEPVDVIEDPLDLVDQSYQAMEDRDNMLAYDRDMAELCASVDDDEEARRTLTDEEHARIYGGAL